MQCENLSISKIHNVQDSTISELATYATDILVIQHLKSACYSLKTLCEELSQLCALANFTVVESENDYVGKVKVRKIQEPVIDLKDLSYIISNRLAYTFGLINYSETLKKGLDNSYTIQLVENHKELDITLDISLLRHLHYLQLSSNFLLQTDKHISYIYLRAEDLITIFEDKLSIPPKNLSNNILSVHAIGKNILYYIHRRLASNCP